MYIIIIGCGRAGSSLANILSDHGEDVVVIDKNEERFKKLSSEFTGFVYCGDGTDIETLRLAKMDKADLVVVTTNRDNINAMVTQIAKKIFKVPQVMVRVIDTAKESFYQDLDVHIFSPTNLLVEKFEETIYKGKEVAKHEGGIGWR